MSKPAHERYTVAVDFDGVLPAHRPNPQRKPDTTSRAELRAKLANSIVPEEVDGIVLATHVGVLEHPETGEQIGAVSNGMGGSLIVNLNGKQFRVTPMQVVEAVRQRAGL